MHRLAGWAATARSWTSTSDGSSDRAASVSRSRCTSASADPGCVLTLLDDSIGTHFPDESAIHQLKRATYTQSNMRYRTFGRTGLSVSTVSMGTNRLGDPGVDPAAWPPIVERALQLGVNFFDTSISYNQGRSEAILGEVTSRHPDPRHIATKDGFDIDFEVSQANPVSDNSARATLRDIAGHLHRPPRTPTHR